MRCDSAWIARASAPLFPPPFRRDARAPSPSLTFVVMPLLAIPPDSAPQIKNHLPFHSLYSLYSIFFAKK